MKCTRCEQEIDGEFTRCAESCICGGREGRVRKDGMLVAHTLDDTTCHDGMERCIAALKHRIMALEAHT